MEAQLYPSAFICLHEDSKMGVIACILFRAAKRERDISVAILVSVRLDASLCYGFNKSRHIHLARREPQSQFQKIAEETFEAHGLSVRNQAGKQRGVSPRRASIIYYH